MGNPSWGKGYHTGYDDGVTDGIGIGVAVSVAVGAVVKAVKWGYTKIKKYRLEKAMKRFPERVIFKTIQEDSDPSEDEV